MLLSILFAVVVNLCYSRVDAHRNYDFRPDQRQIQPTGQASPLGTPYTLASSQIVNSSSPGSFWVSAFISGSDSHQYIVSSQTIFLGPVGYYRAYILDITDPSYRADFQTTITNPSSTITFSTNRLNFTFADYTFATTNQSDPLSPIRTSSTHPNTTFNFTFPLTSPPILNGGIGAFDWNGWTYQWSSPANSVGGTLNAHNSQISIDSSRSFAWYDRQFSPADTSGTGPANFTWFEIHLPAQKKRISLWYADLPDGSHQRSFATMRGESGVQSVVPAEPLRVYGRRWTSRVSGVTYALYWEVVLVDGLRLDINSLKDDQEWTDEDGAFPAYSGFVEVEGWDGDGGRVEGFGLVEASPKARNM